MELQQMKRLNGTDFMGADEDFLPLLQQLGADSALVAKLQNFSARVSTDWDAWAEEAALQYEGPWLESYDAQGHAIEKVCLPPPTRKIREEVVEAGIFNNNSYVEQYAKVYLLAHIGEAGVVCPLACTEGLIRAVREVGSDFLKERYLPQILSSKTPLAGAQFVTEQDMGSDVGALTCQATPDGEGQWRLTGEKWFCSAIDEFFLIAARPQGGAEGTRGVGIFLMPRVVDGKPNGLRIKRLKDKIGTRNLPTAEIELEAAMAYNIGPVEQGFASLMNYVINTSRVMNAASALGMMARACLEAENYARQRSAFGTKIGNYPMVKESLSKMRAILAAKRALYFQLLARMDANPIQDLRSEEAYWQRFLINLCKYRTSIGATECAHEAILQFGGNGTIETFSILPRLYRDSLVIETWEGTHNTLSLQICRDSERFSFKSHLEETFKDAENSVQAAWQETAPLVDSMKDPTWASHHARHMLDRLGSLLELNALSQSPSKELFARYKQQIEPFLRPFDSL